MKNVLNYKPIFNTSNLNGILKIKVSYIYPENESVVFLAIMTGVADDHSHIDVTIIDGIERICESDEYFQKNTSSYTIHASLVEDGHVEITPVYKKTKCLYDVDD